MTTSFSNKSMILFFFIIVSVSIFVILINYFYTKNESTPKNSNISSTPDNQSTEINGLYQKAPCDDGFINDNGICKLKMWEECLASSECSHHDICFLGSCTQKPLTWEETLSTTYNDDLVSIDHHPMLLYSDTRKFVMLPGWWIMRGCYDLCDGPWPDSIYILKDDGLFCAFLPSFSAFPSPVPKNFVRLSNPYPPLHSTTIPSTTTSTTIPSTTTTTTTTTSTTTSATTTTTMMDSTNTTTMMDMDDNGTEDRMFIRIVLMKDTLYALSRDGKLYRGLTGRELVKLLDNRIIEWDWDHVDYIHGRDISNEIIEDIIVVKGSNLTLTLINNRQLTYNGEKWYDEFTRSKEQRKILGSIIINPHNYEEILLKPSTLKYGINGTQTLRIYNERAELYDRNNQVCLIIDKVKDAIIDPRSPKTLIVIHTHGPIKQYQFKGLNTNNQPIVEQQFLRGEGKALRVANEMIWVITDTKDIRI